MSCEIKAKTTMIEGLRGDAENCFALSCVARPACRTSLTSPAGRSLGSHFADADPDLFRTIVKLTEWRNKIVHRGAEVDHIDVWPLVVGAEKLFTWLDNLPARMSSDDNVSSSGGPVEVR